MKTPTTVISYTTWTKSSMQVSWGPHWDDLNFDLSVRIYRDVNVTPTGQSMNVSSIDVRSMLPENLNHFFRYQGSLTTPPCYESILWTVFDTPITLSHNQVGRTGRPLELKVTLICEFAWSCVLRPLFCSGSDPQTGEYLDGPGQPYPVERLPHCSASQ